MAWLRLTIEYTTGVVIVPAPFLKDSLTSTVEVFDAESLSWNSVATTGVPPAAVMQYSCCSLGSKMYTFGGSCKPSDCYHNDLFALDTLNKEWRQVDCIVTKSPMKKQGAGMVSFTSNNDEHLFVFGGFGPNLTPIPSDGQYIRSPYYPDKSFTNEMHMLTVPSSTGQYSIIIIISVIIIILCYRLDCTCSNRYYSTSNSILYTRYTAITRQGNTVWWSGC